MSLRPLPRLDDDSAMAKLGRLYALRSARLDCLHDMRDAISRLMSGSNSDEAGDITTIRACLDRLDEIKKASA